MRLFICFITLLICTSLSYGQQHSAPLACPTADQCTSPILKTSLKISYGPNYFYEHKGKIDTVSSQDLFAVNIFGDHSHMCTTFKDLMVYRDQALIDSLRGHIPSPITFNLMGLPGHYKICCEWQTPSVLFMKYSWEFDLIYVPPIDTTGSSDSSSTGIQNVYVTNPNFQFYPNPASDVLFIENGSDEIKKVSVHNTLSELVFQETLSTTKLSLPLERWPRGVYYVQVATLSEKIIIKKLLVQ